MTQDEPPTAIQPLCALVTVFQRAGVREAHFRVFTFSPCCLICSYHCVDASGPRNLGSCYRLREGGGQWFLPGICKCLECSGLRWKVWILLSFLESMTTVSSRMICPLSRRDGAGYHTCPFPTWWQVSVCPVYLDSLGDSLG